MPPEAAAYLWDARRAGELVQAFIAGRTVEEYVANPLVSSAVERQLAIVGEALNKLSKADPGMASGITDLPRIVSLRNILVHGYTGVDSYLVWQLATTKLPVLLAELEGLLEDLPD